MTYDDGNPGPDLRQAQQCDRAKPVIGPFLSNYWIFNDNTTISIQLKICTNSFPLKNTTRHYKAE
jgi:hypothetical protein